MGELLNDYLELDPARAKSKKPDALWDDPRWIAEEKLDGWRFLMHIGEGLERVYMTGRRTSVTTGMLSEKGLCVPTLWPELRNQFEYTVIDGEVMSPKGFRDIAGIMNTTPDKAARKIAEIGSPSYHVFDILFFNGKDIREWLLIERWQKLQEVVKKLNHPLIHLVKPQAPSLETYNRIVEDGGEGVVLKDLYAPYGEGWIKVKHYFTLDVIITGFKDAKMGVTGKYIGQIGSAEVSVYLDSGELLDVGYVSGMSDDVRLDMSQNPDKWIGAVIEIDAQGFAKDRLRHPRFKRARPDANPKEATLKKMIDELHRDVKVPRQTAFQF